MCRVISRLRLGCLCSLVRTLPPGPAVIMAYKVYYAVFRRLRWEMDKVAVTQVSLLMAVTRPHRIPGKKRLIELSRGLGI